MQMRMQSEMARLQASSGNYSYSGSLGGSAGEQNVGFPETEISPGLKFL